eukprot:CAMPEP_0197072120 /NCGR_PEP_ID=MMETSP1384-20130603/209934_1 /TAXON_ID=29189 /ORGANISM="Ammonia sp." /LENGTH=1656 /DNA_ID=CAMNT_0042510935 /DNA_START=66 /DNA_END=5037 /DNA_ORIENTATION=-
MILTILALWLLARISQATIYYVNPDGFSSGIGTSWSDAFLSLDEALTAATSSGDEVWLKGSNTYIPDTTSRSECFEAWRGIVIYGGFAGNETSPSQRSNYTVTTASILSGDIGVVGDLLDNCYHVLTYSTQLTLDGVIIEHGYADFDDAVEYETHTNTLHKYGGALMMSLALSQSDLVLNNVIFRNNTAINGGALWFKPSASTKAVITNCRFEHNRAMASEYEGGYGGAIYEYLLADVSISNTQFVNNYAEIKGGAVYIDYGAIFSCDECVFLYNVADGYGGALFAEDRNSQTSGTYPVITNSRFERNYAAIHGGAVCLFNTVTITVTNVEFATNVCGQYGGAMAFIDADEVNTNCTFRGNLALGNSFTNNFYREQAASWGDLDSSLSFDVSAELRKLQTMYTSIYPDTDVWPYDADDNVVRICYVMPAINGTSDGTSWATAYVDLQDCIDSLATSLGGGEIWVAAGTYVPSSVPLWKVNIGDTQPKYRSFSLEKNIRLFGGFSGTETSRYERDFAANPTYLSCAQPRSVYCYQILMAADNTIVDGFVFTDAGFGVSARRRLKNSISVEEVLSSTSSLPGAGIFSNSTNIHVANSIFLQLFTNTKGAGVYCIGLDGNGDIKSPSFVNVAFLGNRANIRGGAISADANCNFECTHCTFDSNSCAKKGGAIYLDFDSDPVFYYTSFSNNVAIEAGGAIATDGQSKVTMYDPTFDGNSAKWEGGALYAGSGTEYGVDQGFAIYSHDYVAGDLVEIFTNNVIIDNNPGCADVYLWPFNLFVYDPWTPAPTQAPVVPTPQPSRAPINYQINDAPNFIIFLVDDFEYPDHISQYGPSTDGEFANGARVNYIDAPTPNLDLFISEGVVFPRSYTGGPKCSPSRFTTLTGRYPSRSKFAISNTILSIGGAYDGTDVTLQNSKLLMEDNDVNLAQLMKAANYSTGMVGKWHLSDHDTDNGYNYGCKSLLTMPNSMLYDNCLQVVRDAGFDFVASLYISNLKENEYYSHNPEWMLHEAQSFIRESVLDHKPFFLYSAFTLTHSPDVQIALAQYTELQSPKGTLKGDEVPTGTGMKSRAEIMAQVNIDCVGFTSDSKVTECAADIWIDDALGAMVNFFDGTGMKSRAEIMAQVNIDCVGFTSDSKVTECAADIWIDDALGAMVNFLDSMHVLDNTFIVVMNDHGMTAKGMLYDHGTRIMQYVRFPPLFGKTGYVLPDDFITSNVDLTAVMAEIAGIDITNYPTDGTSWISDVTNYITNGVNGGIDYETNPPSCCQYRYGDVFNSHTVISKYYQYVYRATLFMEDDGFFATMYANVNNTQQLYALQTDPMEQTNLLSPDNGTALVPSIKDTAFDHQYLMVNYVKEIACPAGDVSLCQIPRITYVPDYSNYIPPTPAPTKSMEASKGCPKVEYFSNTWRRVTKFDEATAGPEFLAEAEHLFVAQSSCGKDINNIDYVYKFSRVDKRVELDMIVCCPEKNSFPEGYQFPADFAGKGDAGTAVFDDLAGSNGEYSGTKSLVVIMLSLVIACCCCGFIALMLCVCVFGVKNPGKLTQLLMMLQSNPSSQNDPKHNAKIDAAKSIRDRTIPPELREAGQDGAKPSGSTVLEMQNRPYSTSESQAQDFHTVVHGRRPPVASSHGRSGRRPDVDVKTPILEEDAVAMSYAQTRRT